jgi:TatD DNase family protein
MQFIDVHCHLNETDYGSVDDVLQQANAVGVCKMICAGFDIPSSEYAAALAEKYPFVYFTAGFHPTELKKYQQGDLQKIEQLCHHKKCVAVGEIGLDYHYPDTDKELQAKFFTEQIELANTVGLPVQIHSRDAAEDTFRIVKEKLPLLRNGAMLHCYSYSPELAKEFEKLGLYFSFGGTSTYKRSKKPRRSIQAISPERLLSETDSPYLSPASKFGVFPNTPASIPEVVANMAELLQMPLSALASTLFATAHTLYKNLNN